MRSNSGFVSYAISDKRGLCLVGFKGEKAIPDEQIDDSINLPSAIRAPGLELLQCQDEVVGELPDFFGHWAQGGKLIVVPIKIQLQPADARTAVAHLLAQIFELVA